MTDAPASTAGKGTAAAPPAAEAIIPVPENMDMTVNVNFAKIKYTTYDLNNLDGKIIVKNNVAKLQDCTANLLGGRRADRRI